MTGDEEKVFVGDWVNERIVILDPMTGEVLNSVRVDGKPLYMDVCMKLLGVGTSKGLWIYEVDGNELKEVRACRGYGYIVAFSKSCNFLATSFQGGRGLRICDREGRTLEELDILNVRSITWLDGELVVGNSWGELTFFRFP
ncbi:hypothetical protein EYM_01795 [Ignicoccus islandicus DSM 13165]|uniref:Uncharacterized protein n=1 Tax=Ignicoccus islandicus DSM 13165 TaxID=940295 RepID=A0A0U3DXM3_9CREN|nr:hypothetical protein [Ignicoccus islandicus]ALU12250.1 hypothetical protein EYM_01795 [Ignicoccus islandicus DSM 13165]